jgi:hypothetical protein
MITEENLNRLVEIQQKLRANNYNQPQFNDEENAKLEELKAGIDEIYLKARERQNKDLLLEATELIK